MHFLRNHTHVGIDHFVINYLNMIEFKNSVSILILLVTFKKAYAVFRELGEKMLNASFS